MLCAASRRMSSWVYRIRERQREVSDKRCPNCDKPIADQAEYDALREDEGSDYCWRLFNGGGRGGVCNQPTVDWQAERDALKARLAEVEAGAAAMRAALERLVAVFDEYDRSTIPGQFVFDFVAEAMTYLDAIDKTLAPDAGRRAWRAKENRK